MLGQFRKLRASGFAVYLAKRFAWARKGAWGTVELVVLLIGLALAIPAWCMPRWTHHHISERMNAFMLGALPLLSGASVFLFRWIFLSPYFVHKSETHRHNEHVKEIERERDYATAQLAAIADKRPSFALSWERSPLHWWIGWNNNARTTVATVSSQMVFQNIGDGIAFNTRISTYTCWISNPSRIQYLGGFEFISRTSPNGFLSYNFQAFENALHVGNDPNGKPIWGFSNEGMIICIEFDCRANSVDGLKYEQVEWLYWLPSEAGRFLFPTATMVEFAKHHIDEFKRINQPPAVKLSS